MYRWAPFRVAASIRVRWLRPWLSRRPSLCAHSLSVSKRVPSMNWNMPLWWRASIAPTITKSWCGRTRWTWFPAWSGTSTSPLEILPLFPHSLFPYSAYGKNYLHMLSRSTALERYFESNFAPWFLRQELLQKDWMLPADSAYLMRSLADFLLPGDADLLSQALFFETTQNLPGDMLVKVDRMSMANSLEVRCPLLDHELGELAAGIPHGWKIRDGQGKYILLRALGDRLPPPLLTRQKMGFGVPRSLWFRGALRAFLWDHLTSASFAGRGIVSPANDALVK